MALIRVGPDFGFSTGYLIPDNPANEMPDPDIRPDIYDFGKILRIIKFFRYLRQYLQKLFLI